MLNQKRVDRIVRGQKCLHQRKGEFWDLDLIEIVDLFLLIDVHVVFFMQFK